jgi:hypothetical protein
MKHQKGKKEEITLTQSHRQAWCCYPQIRTSWNNLGRGSTTKSSEWHEKGKESEEGEERMWRGRDERDVPPPRSRRPSRWREQRTMDGHWIAAASLLPNRALSLSLSLHFCPLTLSLSRAPLIFSAIRTTTAPLPLVDSYKHKNSNFSLLPWGKPTKIEFLYWAFSQQYCIWFGVRNDSVGDEGESKSPR